jgi:hypothetical protein
MLELWTGMREPHDTKSAVQKIRLDRVVTVRRDQCELLGFILHRGLLDRPSIIAAGIRDYLMNGTPLTGYGV